MPRILGVDLPNDKPTHISLRYIYGIGPTTALEVCTKAKVVPTRKAKELTKGRLLLRMEDTRSVSGWVGVQELLTGGVRLVDEVVERVEAVTTDDLQRVATLLFRPEKLNVAIVGPYRSGKRFRPLLTV